ncbi:farnesol dehydrogenase-like [Drosophila albomicans]|uniref:Farnesol dehydrogenase-like n=1 Tax=Drosophila albomicans TaxID=7291 RepID=A0A6P8ZFN5_DROAB|nr:farnesol dehydrogenase-like [Drosophila albomicans]
MERWLNRIAVVTGASSGIGAACCKDLVSKGMIVVGLARREDRLKEFKDELPAEQASRFHYYKCDVSDEKQVKATFVTIEKELGGVDVLVNNAGIGRHTSITQEGNSADLRAVIDTNLFGTVWCIREVFLSLQRRHIDDGHVLIINSIAGHRIPIMRGYNINMYASSKYGLTALTEVLRQEFHLKGTKTKITSISPGATNTEMIDPKIVAALKTEFPMLRAEDVADAVSYCISTPPNVQIHELMIQPVGQML